MSSDAMSRVILWVSISLILVGAGVFGALRHRVSQDEAQLAKITVGSELPSVEAMQGKPNLIVAAPFSGPLFQPPAQCREDNLATLWVYERGRWRDSAFVYFDRGGKVRCVERRRIAVVAY